MNPAQLLAHFDRVSDAPEAIPRLRRFILDLAVRGRLVERDQRDESAPELLKRIRAEKARIRKVCGGRIEMPISPLAEDALPFPIPINWCWSQLAEIGFLNPRNTADDGLRASFVPMPLISAEYGDPNSHEVRLWGEIKNGYTHFAEGDVALAKITPCFENGKSTVFRRLAGGIGAGTTELHVVRPIVTLAEYVLIFLKSPHFIESGIPRMTGTAGQKRVPADYFAHSPFPLPPIAEQHRIVAKVEELMALCDALETTRTERERRRDCLAAATLHRVDQPADTNVPEAPREHTRFYLYHLPRLTARPDQIRQLRQTILNLAVRGRLVPQNSNDEPATELVSRIRDQRAKLLERVGINASEAATQLRKQDRQFVPDGLKPLPRGWQWATLMQCSALVVDCHNKTAPYSSAGIILLRTTNVRDGRLNLNEPKFVNEETYSRWSARCQPEPGDMLITREAPMGEVCIIPMGMKVCLGQRMMLARLVPDTIVPKFMLYSLRDPNLMDRVQDKPVGATVQHLRVGGVETLLVPVAPLAEQLRIVAKVDELMALCDQLEAHLTTAQTESRRLLEAVLHEALAS
jgi:type I restriction enzyme S subunit